MNKENLFFGLGIGLCFCAICVIFAIGLFGLTGEPDPIIYKDHKDIHVSVFCHNTFVRNGWLHSESDTDFIIRDFGDFQYPKPVCKYGVIGIIYT